MKSPPRELEIKLELTAAQMRKLHALIKSGEVETTGAQGMARLRSRYFDTPEWGLRQNGLSLRVRDSDEGRTQTVKVDGTAAAGVFDRIETETRIASAEPSVDAIEDKKLRRKVERLTSDSPLVPLFETDITRTTIVFGSPHGAQVEVALDSGAVVAGADRLVVQEVEIELKRGSPAALVAAARAIVGSGPVRPITSSKAERGYRLIGEKPRAHPVSVKPHAPVIDGTMPAGVALSEIFRATSEHVLQNWDLLVCQGHAEAAHQIRVGLRRFRTACLILLYAEDVQPIRDLARSARDTGREVGRLRDIDVLIGDIVAPLAGAPQISKGIELLRRRLVEERKASKASMLAALETPQFGLLRVELGLLSQALPELLERHPKAFQQPVGELAGRALSKLLRRALKRARHLSELTTEERHELRKSLKPFRYALEFLAPLYPQDDVRKLLACTTELQGSLGYLNDVALAESLIGRPWPEDARSADIDRAVGAVVGWHAARAEQAWGDVKAIWKRFERAAAAI